MPNLTPQELLRNAATLEKAAEFTNSQWCRNVNARNAAGQAVHYYSREAATFSAGGHIMRALHQEAADYSRFDDFTPLPLGICWKAT